MTVLFWDIDGTLLTTAKAGVFAWQDAVRELTGREFELIKMRIAGLTDYQIAQRTFETLGIEADEAFLRRFVDRYGELLPASLPRKNGRVLPNVREILEHLAGRPDVRSYLLTGNLMRLSGSMSNPLSGSGRRAPASRWCFRIPS